MVLTVCFVLSPAIGLSCHRRRQRLCVAPDISVEISGPHDFAVRFRSRSSFGRETVHRIPPNVRDDGQRPSRRRDDSLIVLLLPGGQAQFRKIRKMGDMQSRRVSIYSTETRTTPDLIIPSARAAPTDTSITRPVTNGPRSLTRHCIE